MDEPNATSALEGLQRWYLDRCNGDWEHSYGINVGTIDNPGWSLGIDLRQTEFEHLEFAEYTESYDDAQGWLICQKSDGRFIGNCGPLKLERMIRVFLEWITKHNSLTTSVDGG